MSNENQTPTATQESAQNTDKVSPFLTEPLPQGTAQGQQKSLQQQLTDTPVTGSVPNTIFLAVLTQATSAIPHTLVTRR